MVVVVVVVVMMMMKNAGAALQNGAPAACVFCWATPES